MEGGDGRSPATGVADAALARQLERLRERRRQLLEGAGLSADVVTKVEALDRTIEDTFLAFISEQAAELRDVAERFELAVEASDLGLWEFDAATGDRRWSRRCKELFGFPADDAVVTQERFISTLHPDDRPRWHAVLRDAVDPAGEGHYRIEYRIVRPSDGSERWISATGRTQFVDGRPVRMFGTLRDITARKHAEEERDLFLGMLGHDLRAPLGAILIGAQFLMLDGEGETAATATRIAASAKRMERMIEDLLDFARARAGHLQLQLQDMDLAELCREVVDDLAHAHLQRLITLDGATVLRGRWDRDRLRQVIENLVGNALTHGAAAAAVQVRVRGELAAACVDVINEGAPIPEEVRAKIFDPFRRGTSRGPGLGLGLYIAREIVTAHGGTISASSDAGVTRFSVVLPSR